MADRSNILERGASLALVLSACGMLGGCVAAAIAPLAAGGLMGGSAYRRHKMNADKPAPTDNGTKASPGVVAVASRQPASASATSVPRLADPAVPSAPEPRPSPSPTVSARPVEASTAKTTSWDDIARSTAKMAVRTPDPHKADVLHAPGDRTPALCGPKPTAILIDAATLGAGDYLYVGALHTMGFEIVLTSRTKTLPADQVRGLAKQGIATPVSGKTLFLSLPGTEAAVRKTIAGHYCVVALVGNRTADFPGGALPGSPQARNGWYLVTRP